MPDTLNGGARDRARVAFEQDFEVCQFARRHGITQMEAQRLINYYGNDRQQLDAAAERLAGHMAPSTR